MEIRVLGTGCANCKKLEANVFEALSKLDITANVQKLTDIADIMSYGVLSTPGLVVDGELKASGRLLSVSEIMDILKG